MLSVPTALFPCAIARLDVDFDPLTAKELNTLSTPSVGNVRYHGVTIKLACLDLSESYDADPGDLLEQAKPCSRFYSGDSVRDFSDALYAARTAVGTDTGSVDVASCSAKQFVIESGEFYWGEPLDDTHDADWLAVCGGDLTIHRIERNPERLAWNRRLIEFLPVMTRLGPGATLLRNLYEIETTEMTYCEATGDISEAVAYRLAHEAGMRVIAETRTHDSSVRLTDSFAHLIAPAMECSWANTSPDERWALAECWSDYPDLQWIDFALPVCADDDQPALRSFLMLPNESVESFIGWMQEGAADKKP